MKLTKVEHLQRQIFNLKSKLNKIETIVNKMGQFSRTGTKWTHRETIIFNYYGELKNVLR